jgi:hypothetical protein
MLENIHTQSIENNVIHRSYKTHKNSVKAIFKEQPIRFK